VKNEAYMILRKQKRIVPLEDWKDYAVQAGDVTDYVGLIDLFINLPNTYRQVLEMKCLLGYSNKEIVAHLSMTESAVGARIRRGRQFLREMLDKGSIMTDQELDRIMRRVLIDSMKVEAGRDKG